MLRLSQKVYFPSLEVEESKEAVKVIMSLGIAEKHSAAMVQATAISLKSQESRNYCQVIKKEINHKYYKTFPK